MAETQSLTPDEKRELLQAARKTLEVYLTSQKAPNIETSRPALLQKRGTFVTLHKGTQLRGCIGTFEASDPLIDNVKRMAIAAATTDPRFPRVTADELPDIHLEISALTPLKPAAPDEIQVGVHGIYITSGFHRGVLLPQVATENNWDSETFLNHTCLKAGLPSSAWRDPGTVIEVFSAEVFGDKTVD